MTTPSSPDFLLSESGSILDTTPLTLRNPFGACCGDENSILTVGANSREGAPGRYSHTLGSSVGDRGIWNTTTTSSPNLRESNVSRHSELDSTVLGGRGLSFSGSISTNVTTTATRAIRSTP